MEFASDGKEKNKPQESECKYWENETEKNKPHKICHIEKIYWTLGNTIESDVFKIYDRDDDRGPRNRDQTNPTATDRDRDRDTTSAFRWCLKRLNNLKIIWSIFDWVCSHQTACKFKNYQDCKRSYTKKFFAV